MAVVSDVTVRLRIDTSGVESSVAGLGKSMQKSTLGTQVALTQVANTFSRISRSVVGLGTDAYTTFAEFERGMSRVKATAGLTADEFDSIRDKAKELGRATEFTAIEVADAFQSMGLAGFEYKDMMDSIDASLNLATISGLEFGDVTSYMINALKPFNKEADYAGTLVDILAKTATSANFNVNDLAKSFEYVAPIAGAMGYTIEETSVALALLAENGLKGSKAGTALRKMLTDLNTKAEEGVISFGDYSVAITETDGSMRPLLDVLGEMAGAFDNLTESERAQYAETLVGKTGMAGFLAIMNGGVPAIEEMTAKVYDFEGASSDMADTIRNDAQGGIDGLKSAWEGLKIEMGDVMDKALRPIIKVITEVTRKIANMDDKTKGIIVALGIFATVFAGLTAFVAGAVGIWLMLGAVFGTIAGSVLLLIGIIAGLVAVVAWVWLNWEEFCNFMDTSLLALREWFIEQIELIKEGFKSFFDAIKRGFDNAKDWFLDLGNNFKQGFQGVIDFWKEKFREAGDQLRNFKENCANTVANIKQGFIDAWTKVADSFRNNFQSVIDWFKNFPSWLSGTIEQLKTDFFNGFKSIKDGIIDNIRSACDWAKELISNIFGGVKIKMPHFSFSGEFSLNPLSVPKLGVDWYAKGGIFSGASVIGVGERGDEAVIPLSNSTKVRPFAQAVATEMGSSSGGGDININVGELVVREEADVRKIAQELYKLQQFKSRGKGRY